MTKTRGFTLIELMIVVTIIAIIVAIAVPNLLRSRVLANENAAVGTLKTIIQAQTAFNTQSGRYSQSFDELTGAAPPYLNGDWTRPKNGYMFVLGGTVINYTVTASPLTFGTDGTRGFFVDASGVIRVENGTTATAASTPITQSP